MYSYFGDTTLGRQTHVLGSVTESVMMPGNEQDKRRGTGSFMLATRRFMKIICGTDFSAHAHEAGRVAAALAARLDCELGLVHALDTSNYKDLSKELHEHFRTSRQGTLDTEAKRLGHSGAKITG